MPDSKIRTLRAARRRARTLKEVYELLAPARGLWLRGVVQCGLGDWAEGPALLDLFGSRDFLAIEPIQRYCHEAWRDGFRGPIIQAALWDVTGIDLTLQDFRYRTSILDKERRWGAVPTRTITLDDAIRYVRFDADPYLLWMDCEGVELTILQGAKKTLAQTNAIVCELKDEPKLPGWPVADVVIATIESLGFKLHHRVVDDGLFIKA